MKSTYKTTRQSDVANQLMLFIAIILLWLCTLCTPTFAEDNSSRQIPHNAKMSYLENRLIRMGVDLNLGGAIVFVASAGIVNPEVFDSPSFLKKWNRIKNRAT